MKQEPLDEKQGWKLFEDAQGGYFVCSPSGVFGGWSSKRDAAQRILLEKSGAIEETYPVVKPEDVKVVVGQKIKGNGKWHRLDQFYYKKKFIGQVRIKGSPYSVTTEAMGKSCDGYDLAWMLRQNKLQLGKG